MDKYKNLKHIFIPDACNAKCGTQIILMPEKLNYLRNVLRMDFGTDFVVTDGAGRLMQATLEQSTGKAFVNVGSLIAEQSKPLDLKLEICLSKNNTMDWLVEKAVECGVTEILPIISSRSVVKVKHDEDQKYVRRWQAIMDGALEQSEQLWRPLVLSPVQWRKWCENQSINDLSQVRMKKYAFVSEARDKISFQESWSELSQSANPMQVLIGPEGGFSEDERNEISQNGYRELSLGQAILRVETAVVSGLTLARLSQNKRC